MTQNSAVEAVRSFADGGPYASSSEQDSEAFGALVERLARLSGADTSELRYAFLANSYRSFDRSEAQAFTAVWDWLDKVERQPAVAATLAPRYVGNFYIPEAVLAEVIRLRSQGENNKAVQALRAGAAVGRSMPLLRDARAFVDALPAVKVEEPEVVPRASAAVRNDDDLSAEDDWLLVESMLADARFREAMFNFTGYTDNISDARDVVRSALGGNVLDSTHYRKLLRAYDLVTGRIDQARLDELERLRKQASELADRITQLTAELAP